MTEEFVIHSVLYEHIAENLSTPRTPIAPWEEQADLEERVRRCMSFDDDRPVDTCQYAVHPVTLPAWLPLDEWIEKHIAWHWAWGFDTDPHWPASWQRWIAYDDVEWAHKLAAIELLRTHWNGRHGNGRGFKSSFRRSLAEQLVQWLETPPENRQYLSPLSARQWAALVKARHRKRARNLGGQLYRQAGNAEIVGVPTDEPSEPAKPDPTPPATLDIDVAALLDGVVPVQAECPRCRETERISRVGEGRVTSGQCVGVCQACGENFVIEASPAPATTEAARLSDKPTPTRPARQRPQKEHQQLALF